MSILDKFLRVTMPDGSRWDVPIRVIAENRAAHYADEFEGDVARSLAEDTGPFFEEDPSEVTEWSSNQMNFSDFGTLAVKVNDPAPTFDFEEGWRCGRRVIVEDHEPIQKRRG
jgi:hypothetical protein